MQAWMVQIDDISKDNHRSIMQRFHLYNSDKTNIFTSSAIEFDQDLENKSTAVTAQTKTEATFTYWNIYNTRGLQVAENSFLLIIYPVSNTRSQNTEEA